MQLIKFFLIVGFAIFVTSCTTSPKGSYFQSGVASWYGKKFHGRKTASGEKYNMYAMTAAHKTLPFGTRVRVVDPNSGKSVIVTVNDRGPFVRGRVIDLSYKAAQKLNFTSKGHIRVILYLLR